jgi:hypothetical protein
MAKLRRRELIEAYQYSGDPEKPGWPDGWCGLTGRRIVGLSLSRGDWVVKCDRSNAVSFSVYHPPPVYGQTGVPQSKPCHGCGGSGWVTVPDTMSEPKPKVFDPKCHG